MSAKKYSIPVCGKRFSLSQVAISWSLIWQMNVIGSAHVIPSSSTHSTSGYLQP